MTKKTQRNSISRYGRVHFLIPALNPSGRANSLRESIGAASITLEVQADDPSGISIEEYYCVILPVIQVKIR
jgi:hypothetical protein